MTMISFKKGPNTKIRYVQSPLLFGLHITTSGYRQRLVKLANFRKSQYTVGIQFLRLNSLI